MKYIAAALALLLSAAPAHAEWQRAESDHFVIYADDSEKDISRFADMLERYDAAMAIVTGTKLPKPSPSNRVTIYAVGGQRNVRELAGDKKSNIAGFYIPRAGGSVAFVPDVRASTGDLDFSMIVLLHDYAHHFLISNSRFAMPAWMSEGAAEFFASARFPSNGEVDLGRPANHRAGELAYARDVSITDLLSRGETGPGRRLPDDSFYGRSWALYHFLIFNEARRGQLVDYAKRVAGGATSLAAAEAAFGDLKVLDKEVDAYLGKRRLMGLVIAADKLPIGPIRITPVSAGMAEMMPVIVRSKRGVDKESSQEVLVDAREIAARWPQDAGVLAALAEAEYDAGNDKEAIAAADRAIAIDPTARNAYVNKGYALFREAAEARDKKAAYAEAMKPFSALNRIEQDHPLPLIYYYRSFAQQGIEPTENAKHALERALELAPFDQSLALNVALMQASEGKIALAMHNLAPVAASPHSDGVVSAARQIREDLSHVEEGTKWRPGVIVDLSEAASSAVPGDD